MVLINIITIVALVVTGVVGFHFYHNTTSHVTTDDVKVDGDQTKITSPVSGQIKSFDAKQGDKLKKGDTVIEVTAQGRDGQTQDQKIKTPQGGTTTKTDGIEGSIAQADSPTAYAYNLDDLYITANIDEDDLNGIEKGDKADVTINGRDSKTDGRIREIGKTITNSFLLMPSSDSDGNHTKVSQAIPVKISLDSQPSKGVVSGMNIEVRTRKD